MALADLIKKGVSGEFATATVATFATDSPPDAPTVATVATIAVATGEKIQIIRDAFDADGWSARIAETVESVAAADMGALSWCREHYPDLHRQCLESGRQIDECFGRGDQKALVDSLEHFLDTHQQARDLFTGGDSEPVGCGDCRHFERNQKNPAQGAGRCSVGKSPNYPYPVAARHCLAFQGVLQ